MKTQRYQARVLAMQTLYELDMQRLPADTETYPLLALHLKESGVDREHADYARALVAGAWCEHARYDEMIGQASDHWDVARMAVVDRNVLRLALYELIERPDVPARVVIDQAIELGREFGVADSPKFINGVLDAIWKDHPACQLARAAREAAAKS